ncbi:MAG TPA: sigma-70 family RNA polymerase sigma factor [Planctomycetota bacterium]|jgi:RNA polymerase sigma-70 factor (ECF subfamily)|nr:sigma-70 family RNA polymerase sigma factor [Planctomycetota bacterium]
MPRNAQRRAGTAADDAVLIERSRKGEPGAFEALMSKYANLVGSIAFNIVGDPHVAGDITQETFLKVYRNLARLEDPRRFKGWLCSIVRTTCVDWLRKERVKPCSLEKISEDGLEPEGEFLGGVFRQTSTEVEELREKILHIVNGLPRIYQQIIFLRHLRKMTYREMSDFLGLPVATIESRLYRARIMLKNKLMDLYL